MMNNARLIFYPPSLAKYTCTYLRSALLLYSQPLASEDVFCRELMIVAALLSSICFRIRKKKIDDIV